ncbi:hypothetical protein A2592_02480 [Candidatus Kaiserbacteria bacterium RIFOXYD1_FULL_42_15]|uniref:DUF11 domain-containing protein n=1 Tax=Candidatus Kaiserbacteria bacterium RIFOXYD1_FULL_42_15 TaxID=1798532 RepID=A0A1F6FPP2_9BACT|nr:MAG: hypothetical protein A2592_02480 [Candidatus Kaiserbacteria bacterium RIFOXYD1_FULL_42_15]
MPPLKNQAQIEDMRRRLYERGINITPKKRHELSDNPQKVADSWQYDRPAVSSPTASIGDSDPRPATLTKPKLEVLTPTTETKKRWFHNYRTIILMVTLVSFLVVLGGTSIYLFFGSNQISNKNIDINISGSLTTGGGEIMSLQVTVANLNKVSIESAVLIVNYPSGTKSADDTAKDLFEDRIQLNSINAGETINVPVKAVMYGEENQEGEIKATIEYRLVDSNGTFYKDATPLVFRITSSPLVIRVDSVSKVSAGQEVDVTLTIQSNASTPLKDIIVSADYPTNFDFTSSEPAPSYRENSWLIKEIAPEESTTIVLKGLIVGKQNEEFRIQFLAGTPQQNNQFIIGSTLAEASADFIIEQPFIDVGLSINGLKGEVVTLQTGEETTVVVEVQNTLVDTLYNMSLEVGVVGNSIIKDHVTVQNGYYDSVKNVIRYQVSGDSSLAQVAPGATKRFTFSILPSNQKQTPSFMVTANAYARRVSEDSATEQLVGTAKSEAKFASSVSMVGKITHGSGVFTDIGAIPPIADTKTTYTVTLTAGAGGNNVSGVSVSSSLPQYVGWENKTTGDGTIIFNPVSNEITWTVGDIVAGKEKQISFQISLLPSQNQIGTTPALLGAQRLRGTDLFTGTVVRAEAVPLSAELDKSLGFGIDNGVVGRTAD